MFIIIIYVHVYLSVLFVFSSSQGKTNICYSLSALSLQYHCVLIQLPAETLRLCIMSVKFYVVF